MNENYLSLWDNGLKYIIINTTIYILVYFIGSKMSIFILNVISNKLDRQAIHWNFAKKTLKSILLIISVMGIASGIPGLDKFVTTIIASSTVIVAAVGLASQESMANIVSGMFISIFKPFAVGDRVKLISCGLVGIIEDINLRHTIIKTVENNRLIIPNTTMNKEIVENSNYVDGRICNFLDVKISYDSDISKSKEIISRLIIEHPDHLDWRSDQEKLDHVPIAKVLVRNITNQGIELRVGVWTADIGSNFQMCSDLRQNIIDSFKKHNIKLYQQVIIQKYDPEIFVDGAVNTNLQSTQRLLMPDYYTSSNPLAFSQTP